MIEAKVLEALGENANAYQLDEVIALMLIYSEKEPSAVNRIVPGSEAEKLINSWNNYFSSAYN